MTQVMPTSAQLGVPPSHGGLLEVAGQMVSAPVAVGSGDGLDPSEDP